MADRSFPANSRRSVPRFEGGECRRSSEDAPPAPQRRVPARQTVALRLDFVRSPMVCRSCLSDSVRPIARARSDPSSGACFPAFVACVHPPVSNRLLPGACTLRRALVGLRSSALCSFDSVRPIARGGFCPSRCARPTARSRLRPSDGALTDCARPARAPAERDDRSGDRRASPACRGDRDVHGSVPMAEPCGHGRPTVAGISVGRGPPAESHRAHYVDQCEPGG